MGGKLIAILIVASLAVPVAAADNYFFDDFSGRDAPWDKWVSGEEGKYEVVEVEGSRLLACYPGSLKAANWIETRREFDGRLAVEFTFRKTCPAFQVYMAIGRAVEEEGPRRHYLLTKVDGNAFYVLGRKERKGRVHWIPAGRITPRELYDVKMILDSRQGAAYVRLARHGVPAVEGLMYEGVFRDLQFQEVPLRFRVGNTALGNREATFYLGRISVRGIETDEMPGQGMTSLILSPADTLVNGKVEVAGDIAVGRVYDLSCAAVDGGHWEKICSGGGYKRHDLLGVWDTRKLADGDYLLKLAVKKGEEADGEHVVRVTKGTPAYELGLPEEEPCAASFDDYGNLFVLGGNGTVSGYNSLLDPLDGWMAAQVPAGLVCEAGTAGTRDEAGRLYLAETDEHAVRKFGAYGNRLMSFGSYGVVEGLFDRPRGVALDGDGAIFVADSGNDRIQVFRSGEAADPFGFAQGRGRSGEASGVEINDVTVMPSIVNAGQRVLLSFAVQCPESRVQSLEVTVNVSGGPMIRQEGICGVNRVSIDTLGLPLGEYNVSIVVNVVSDHPPSSRLWRTGSSDTAPAGSGHAEASTRFAVADADEQPATSDEQLLISSLYMSKDPFAPRRGESTGISYLLSRDAAVSVVIVDKNRNPVWRMDFTPGMNGGKAGQNAVLWNGIRNRGSHLGEKVQPGIYYISVIASVGGETVSAVTSVVAVSR